MSLISPPEHATFSAPHVARVHVVTPRNEIQQAMHAAIHEIVAALQQQQIRPAGAWFAHHHRRPTETFDFDVCFPVASAITPTGRVEAGSIPQTPVIRSVYRGNYDGLPQAWPEFLQWIEQNGVRTRQDAFEVYTIGPQENPDPAQWETEMNYALNIAGESR